MLPSLPARPSVHPGRSRTASPTAAIARGKQDPCSMSQLYRDARRAVAQVSSSVVDAPSARPWPLRPTGGRRPSGWPRLLRTPIHLAVLGSKCRRLVSAQEEDVGVTALQAGSGSDVASGGVTASGGARRQGSGLVAAAVGTSRSQWRPSRGCGGHEEQWRA